jgi:hypothetical protein
MDLQDLFPIVVTFVAVGVLLSFALNVQGTIKNSSVFGYSPTTAGCNATSQTSCGYEYNATLKSIQANDNISSNLPILGTIIIAAIVVGVLVKAFVMQ